MQIQAHGILTLAQTVFGAGAAHKERMGREQFAYMTLTLCRHYAPNLEASFKVYVFNLDP